MKKNAANTNSTVNPQLQFIPERREVDAAAALKMAEKCTDYNDSRRDAQNFRCVEIRGVKFLNEDLSGVEMHYGKFVDCEFEACRIGNSEWFFAELDNCVFNNCSLKNANFSFAAVKAVFRNCDLRGADFPFASGEITCHNCMMENCTAQNAELRLILTDANARGFEANSARLDLKVGDSNLRGAEFNDGHLRGEISRSDLGGAELNRSDLTDLKLIDCAVSGLETENAVGLEEDMDSLEDILDED